MKLAEIFILQITFNVYVVFFNWELETQLHNEKVMYLVMIHEALSLSWEKTRK